METQCKNSITCHGWNMLWVSDWLHFYLALPLSHRQGVINLLNPVSHLQWIQFRYHCVYVHWKLAILQLNMPILWECLHTMIKVTTNEHLCMPMNEAYVFFYHKNCNFTHTVGFWATNNTQYGTTDHAWVVLEWSRHSLMSYITTSSNMPIPVLAAK